LKKSFSFIYYIITWNYIIFSSLFYTLTDKST